MADEWKLFFVERIKLLEGRRLIEIFLTEGTRGKRKIGSIREMPAGGFQFRGSSAALISLEMLEEIATCLREKQRRVVGAKMADKAKDIQVGQIARFQCTELTCSRDWKRCKGHSFLLIRVIRRDSLAIIAGREQAPYFLNIDCGYPGTSYLDMPGDTPCEILDARLSIERIVRGRGGEEKDGGG